LKSVTSLKGRFSGGRVPYVKWLGVDVDVVVPAPTSATARVAVFCPGVTANSVAVANVVVRFGMGEVVAVSVGLAAGDSVGGADVSVAGTAVSIDGSVAVSLRAAGGLACVSSEASAVGCARETGRKFEGRHAPMISRITAANTIRFMLPSFGQPRTLHKTGIDACGTTPYAPEKNEACGVYDWLTTSMN
jgi:hypothetical protein